jgi:hypothetical protein
MERMQCRHVHVKKQKIRGKNEVERYKRSTHKSLAVQHNQGAVVC